MENYNFLSCRELLGQFGYSCENPMEIECETGCPVCNHCNLYKRFHLVIGQAVNGEQ